MSPTEEILLSRFGGSPLLSLSQFAEVLHRSADGLRVSLRGNTDLARKMSLGRVKIGRRVYFRTESVARLIDEATA